MASPNQNSAEMQAWLRQANQAQFDPNPREFGSPVGNTNQDNPSDKAIAGAGRSTASDGSLDTDE